MEKIRIILDDASLRISLSGSKEMLILAQLSRKLRVTLDQNK